MNDFVQNIYPPLYAKGTRTIAKPGDRIPMKGLDVRIPTAGGRRDQGAAAGRRPGEPVLRGSSRRRRRIPPRTPCRWART